MAGMSPFGSYMRKKGKKQGYAKGLEEGKKQGEMGAAQAIARRKDEAAARARGMM
jgi:flagellar biosynthesis/type III secretory pathway protein FliH